MMPARKGIVAFTTQYAISILSGAFSFLFLSLLSRRLDSDHFSQVSFVIQLLPFYLICTDLGSHNQHILRINNAREHEREHLNSELILTRASFAFAAIFISILQGLISGVESATFWMSLIYLSCLIPFSFVSSLDTIHFALGEEKKAILLRLFRITGMTAAIAVAFASRGAPPIALIFSFTIAVWIGALLFLIQSSQKKNFFSGATLLSSLTQFKPSRNYAPYRYTAPLFLGVMFFSLFVQSVVVRKFGDRNLSDWTSAVAFITPFTIALQTLAQLVARPISRSIGNSIDLHKSILKYRVRFASISIALLLGYAVMVFLNVHVLLFPHATSASIPLIFGNALYQILILFPNVEVLLMQHRGQSSAALKIFIFSCVPTAFFLIFFSHSLNFNEILAAVVAQSFLYSFGILAFSRWEKIQISRAS